MRPRPGSGRGRPGGRRADARVRVFRALVDADPSGMTPGDLATTLGVAPSTLSFDLKELTRAGLVSQQRDGRHLIDGQEIERMNALLAYPLLAVVRAATAVWTGPPCRSIPGVARPAADRPLGRVRFVGRPGHR